MSEHSIIFENNTGMTMKLSKGLTVEDLVKLGVTEIRLEKKDAPLCDGWWRNVDTKEAAK